MGWWSKNVTAKVSEFNDKTVGKAAKAVSETKDKVEDATGLNTSDIAKSVGKDTTKFGISCFVPGGTYAVLAYDIIKNKNSIFGNIKEVKDIGKSEDAVDLINSSSKAVSGISSVVKAFNSIFSIFA